MKAAREKGGRDSFSAPRMLFKKKLPRSRRGHHRTRVCAAVVRAGGAAFPREYSFESRVLGTRRLGTRCVYE